jgi:hypothetical protein
MSYDGPYPGDAVFLVGFISLTEPEEIDAAKGGFRPMMDGFRIPSNLQRTLHPPVWGQFVANLDQASAQPANLAQALCRFQVPRRGIYGNVPLICWDK